MRFLSPLALVGLALIALPIAIHLLVRRRATRLDFPSLMFLRETPSFRLRPRRIQQPLLLALRILAFALLVLGFSSPLFSIANKSPRTRVILLDASLSMRARGVAEAAREQARTLINNLGANERAAIIAFASDPLILTVMTSDKRVLSEAIDRYQPTNDSADYVAGIRAAGMLLPRDLAGETLIDLVSDFQVSGFPGDERMQDLDRSIGRVQVVTHPIGAELERNASLLDFDVSSGDSGTEISATELIAVGDERNAERKSWTLNSSSGSRIDIEWRTEPNGQITARIQSPSPDDFDPDDGNFMTFELPRMGRALLIERDRDDTAPYMRAAFEATKSEMGEKRFVFESMASLPTSFTDLGYYSLVALTLHGAPRQDEMRILADFARAGGTVWLCMGIDVDTMAWNQFAGTEVGRFLPFTRVERVDDKLQATGFGSVDADAPALRAMNDHLLAALHAARMRQGFSVTPRVDSATLIRWNNHTSAFVGAAFENGNVLILATSPARTAGDLGASAAFPALASSIVKFSLALDNPVALEIGKPVLLGLTPGAVVKVIDANERSHTATARDLVMTPALYFPEPGIYRVESDSFKKFVAINTPTSESDFSLATAAELERVFKRSATPSDTRNSFAFETAERPGSAWRYFLLAAFVLLLAEMFIAVRQREGEPN